MISKRKIDEEYSEGFSPNPRHCVRDRRGGRERERDSEREKEGERERERERGRKREREIVLGRVR